MDINCVVCGEPWDAYGVNHGDMTKWEADLFRKGAGCPCCEGEINPSYQPSSIFDFENGDQDPYLRIVARQAVEEGTKPKWERPEDPLIWKCAGCDIEVRRDVDSGELFYRQAGKCLQWYSSHPLSYRDEADKDPDIMLAGFPLCQYCHESCGRCGEAVSTILEGLEDEAGYYCQSNNKTFCYDCITEQCSECNGWYDGNPSECTCSEDEEESEDE